MLSISPHSVVIYMYYIPVRKTRQDFSRFIIFLKFKPVNTRIRYKIIFKKLKNKKIIIRVIRINIINSLWFWSTCYVYRPKINYFIHWHKASKTARTRPLLTILWLQLYFTFLNHFLFIMFDFENVPFLTNNVIDVGLFLYNKFINNS